MHSPHTALAHGRAPLVPRHVGVRSELGWSRSTCRFQPLVIDLLGGAVSTWRRATAALKAASANLRAVAVRVQLTRTTVRLEVEGSGRRGVIAPRPPDPERGGGFGLPLVPALSRRLSPERVAEGGSRVWAQLRRAPVTVPAATTNPSGHPGGGRPSQFRINQRGGRRPNASYARRRTAMTELHVIPDERTTWRVYEAGASSPLSEHTNATDAELAALARADDRDDERVVVHDRYHRTHDAAPSRAELRARARLVRARQLALVAERARQLTRNSGTP